MKRPVAVLLAILVLAGVAALAQQPSEEQQRELRTRIEERFDVVPLTDSLALRPKTRMRDVRLIEISADGSVAINGEPVTGREIRERLGSDADAVLRLSQLDAEARRALLAPREPVAVPPAQEPVERAEPVEKEPATGEPTRQRRRSSGDRVRIFGDVTVPANESITGQAVAVMGSVRVDGEVGDQVVAVLGSVELGPNAVVGGDVVSVGGEVRRAEGAQIRGTVTQVALGDIDVPAHVRRPGDWWGPMWVFGGFSAVPRLIGSVFRLLLLILLTALAYVIVRPTVEAAAHRLTDNPVQATFVGLAAEILLIPTLVLTSIVLVIIIIGIPLLLLIPFIVLALLLMALIGFTGVAAVIGSWFRGRTGIGAPGFSDVALGVVLILLPLLVGRLIGLGGWGLTPVAFLFVAAGLTLEFLAWTAGFGAVLTNAFSRWQARRASRVPVAPPPTA